MIVYFFIAMCMYFVKKYIIYVFTILFDKFETIFLLTCHDHYIFKSARNMIFRSVIFSIHNEILPFYFAIVDKMKMYVHI